MNYRHAYHAGNFADVIKHAVLCRVLAYLREKPAAFRVIDTHAGAGVYDLTAAEAGKTGEWRDGIGRLLSAQLDPDTRKLLAPYLDAIAACNPPERLTTYPGSPALVRGMLRRQDRLIACELEPRAAAALARNLHGDIRVKTIAIDGWTALSAYVPPKERRGVVLIDPPFEQPDEFSQLAQGLENAHRKWPTGIYLLWYPIKEPSEVAAFARRLVRSGISKILRVELDVGPSVAPGADATKLQGTGLIVVNPPWTLQAELSRLLPAIAAALGRDGKGGVKLGWLAGEAPK
jgi:23S rRNA (adenine2030-N6)-methyltransferase